MEAYPPPPYSAAAPTPPPVKEPQRRGRRKISIEYISDKSRRQITFSKRKAGIMKKAYELATLTGTQVLLLVASESGHVYTFATPKLQPLITEQEGKNLIQNCLNAPSSNNPDQNEAAGDQDSPTSSLNIRAYAHKREVDDGDADADGDEDDEEPEQIPIPKAEPQRVSQKVSDFAQAGSYPMVGGSPAYQSNYLNHLYSRQMPVSSSLPVSHLPGHPPNNFIPNSSLPVPGFPSYAYNSSNTQGTPTSLPPGQYGSGNNNFMGLRSEQEEDDEVDEEDDGAGDDDEE